MIPTKKVSSKICFVGNGGVGKTSLIGRYVYDKFDDKYLATIGTKVSRKEITLDYPDRSIKFKMDAIIWDIMGQKAFRGLLQDAYFHGARGVIGVCNLADKESLTSLTDWVKSVKNVVGRVPFVLLANKKDLEGEVQVSEAEIEDMATRLSATYLYTSAKTGENVQKAFNTIGREMIKNQFNMY